jgi:uncharacterized protein YjiS (DUF1127 family)
MITVSLLPSIGGSRYPSPLQKARRLEWRRLPQRVCLRAIGVLCEWRRRSRDRAQFALLDDRMLRDIGVSRRDMLAETNKPFWRQ